MRGAARGFWITRDLAGDQCYQLFTREPADQSGEWGDVVGRGSLPGRPTAVLLPSSAAVDLLGHALSPGMREFVSTHGASIFNARGSTSSRKPYEVRRTASPPKRKHAGPLRDI
jgi:hypothetical protein